MRYLRAARNITLLRVTINVLVTVASIDISGFHHSEGLTVTISLTKLL
jgi:hypothetical protein